MGTNGLKVQTAVSLQLQRTLHDPSRGTRVLSSEAIGHFLKKKKYKFRYFLTTNARLALARPHEISYVGKVTREVGETKQTCKVKRPLQKKVKQQRQMILKLKEKIRWHFSPYSTFLNIAELVQDEHLWLKKYINLYFSKKMADRFAI